MLLTMPQQSTREIGGIIDHWEHLFRGEFAERRSILSNLTLAQATALPGHATHSVYDELWHVVQWQNFLVAQDDVPRVSTWQKGEEYPSAPPTDEQAWLQLVEEFLSGIEQALRWTRSPELLALETDPGTTMAEELRGLAVHNSYHLGKIVALRQIMGLWPNTPAR
jgi:uncharacterized damage-inducible protein DinB